MRIDGLISGQNLNLSSITDILGRLNIGDIIRAQILEIAADALTLRLSDGSTFTASSMVPVEAKRGDFIEFSVKNKQDKQVFLEIVKNATLKAGNEEEIKKQLIAVEIKPEPQVIELTKEVRKNDIPLNREVIQKAAELLLKFKDITPSKAAFLSVNQIEPTPQNLNALNQLTDLRITVGTELGELSQLISEIDDAAVMKKLESAFQKVSISQNLPEHNENVKNTANMGNQPADTESTTAVNLPVSKDITQITREMIQMLKREDSGKTLNISQFQNEMNELLESTGLFDLAANQQEMKPIDRDRFIQHIKQQIFSYDFNFLTDETLQEPLVENPLKEIQQLKRNEPAESETQGIKASAEDNPRETIKKVLSDLFVKTHSDHLKEDIEINKLHKEIAGKLEIIKEIIGQSNIAGREEILSKVENMENNLRFRNEMSHQTFYAQIPLNLSGFNTTGEIYILKRESNRKKIDPQNATMLVSLDTENIGRVDSLVSVNKKNIIIHMRVEKSEIFDIIKENYKDLYHSLQEKGYKLVDLKYRLHEERIDPLNVKQVIRKAMDNKHFSFDYRI